MKSRSTDRNRGCGRLFLAPGGERTTAAPCRKSGRLERSARPGDLAITAHAAWGMSVVGSILETKQIEAPEMFRISNWKSVNFVVSHQRRECRIQV